MCYKDISTDVASLPRCCDVFRMERALQERKNLTGRRRDIIREIQLESQKRPSFLGLVGVNMGILSMPIDEAAETPKCSPGTSNTVSPFDISPVPNIKKRTTTRGRKATRSSLITESPYKDQLTKSLEKSAPRRRP
ncbi:hypothetical protein AVEN_113269-1 [Araneus ventricosus]|uniref:Uncharacterized protein n=1 Tax=Araneus ventricosus TaxID=182803 RepID=A0A4Y2NW83_ARAVE|nr:hypothetical protein AVEN_113269-1 [Araneus ventricosus]